MAKKKSSSAKMELIAASGDFLFSLKYPNSQIQPFSNTKKLYDCIIAVKEDAFREKLELFIYERDIGTTKRKATAFLKSLSKNRDSFIANLLLTIDNLDQKLKAPIHGRMFAAVANRTLSLDNYHLLTSILIKIYWGDLIYFKSSIEKPSNVKLVESIIPNKILSSLGLFIETINVETAIGTSPTFPSYELSEIGREFKKYL